jgi:co-chaperonin GroES (HSP10)
MTTKLRPLGARVVVERLPLPDQTRGGLWLLGREYPTIGRVLAVAGLANRTDPFLGDLALGDLVVFDKFAPELRAIPREPEHFVIDAKDIFLRIREDTDDNIDNSGPAESRLGARRS